MEQPLYNLTREDTSHREKLRVSDTHGFSRHVLEDRRLRILPGHVLEDVRNGVCFL